MKGAPPVAPREVKQVVVQHGVGLADEYEWIGNRKDPRVLPLLKKENAHYKQWAKDNGVNVLQKKIFKEIKKRTTKTLDSVPYRYKGWMYQRRFSEGKDYPVHIRFRPGSPKEHTVLVDVNKVAKGHSFCKLRGVHVSPDNALFSYAVDLTGDTLMSIHFIDAATMKPLKDVLKVTSSAQVWAADSKHFFYVKKDPVMNRGKCVMRHVIGTSQKSDVVVYDDPDITFNMTVWKSMSEQYIFFGSVETDRTEYHFIAADEPSASPKVFYPRVQESEKHEYYVDHWENDFLVMSNRAEDGKTECENFRLASVPINAASYDISHWTTIRPHDPEFLLESVEPFKDFVVVAGRSKGLPVLEVLFPKNPSKNHLIDFGDEKCYDCSLGTNAEYNAKAFRYFIESMVTPETVLEYDPETKKQNLLKRFEYPTFDPSLYSSERLQVASRDGTAQIPVSICYRKGVFQDGRCRKLFLYAYGAYGSNVDPYFSKARPSLMDRGAVFAIAHVRGSSTLGKHWYDDGRLRNKINSFNDLNDVAALLKEKYADEIVCCGDSAGGLLVCASVNREPSLYTGVIANVPFVDVVRVMLNPEAKLTAGEWNEWGNPIKSVEDFDYMLSYDPYHNVERKPYPTIFLLGGYNDFQVDYSEPVKIAQRYRYYSTSDNEILCWVDLDKGHGGTSGRISGLHDVARDYALALTFFSKE